jgi:AAA15 family ATPase/GTPase
MFIEFTVTNYRSILSPQKLSMVASNYEKDALGQNKFQPTQDESFSLLRSVVLYGANASGKSTFIQALQFVKNQVINSQKESQAGEAIEVLPFKLTKKSILEDSEFELVFIEQGVRYQYGFCCNANRFTEEWLIAYPNGRAQKWFHRVYDSNNSTDTYKFSSTFLGGRQRQITATQTRSNALYLSTAVQFNNAQLMPVFNWFKNKLRVVSSSHLLSDSYTKRMCEDEEAKLKIIQFMNSADLNIADIQLKKEVFSTQLLPKILSEEIKNQVSHELSGKELTTLRYIHQLTDEAGTIEFEENEESDGTRTLFTLAGPWLDVIKNERVLVVDELDSSLHPLLVHYLIKALHMSKSHAQLIFTTHDSTLLSQKLLRRDQVWFTEKDEKNSTKLFPLSDFSPRENEAIEKGYLVGRYGGIPFLKDLDFYG